MMAVEWNTASVVAMAIVSVGSAISGSAALVIRHTLRATFATVGQVGSLSMRLTDVEKRLEQMPTHQDIAGLGTRLGAVEQGVAVARAEIGGVRDGVSRVEHMMGLLIKAGLDKEKVGQ